MAERDQFGGALGGKDARHPRHGERVTLGQGRLPDGLDRVRRHPDEALRDRRPARLGLASYVDHAGRAGLVHVRQPFPGSHRRSSICRVVRAVLFDYGLTLVRFTFPRRELVQVLEQVRPWLGPNVPDTETLMRDVIEAIENQLPAYGEEEIDYLDFYDRAWRRAGVTMSRETLYRVLDLEQQCWDRSVHLAPDALQTLDGLRVRGLRTAIASNAPFPPEMMHRQVRLVGIGERVDAVVFSSEIGRRKPAPELYLSALGRLGTVPAEALYVGDRVLEDFEGPRRLGMRAVLCKALAREQVRDGIPT